MNLVDYLPETAEALEAQLKSDQRRWGDTWKHRPVKATATFNSQEHRAFQRFNDYFDQYLNAGTPIPWLKIMGECHICITRENHPEELEVEDA